MIKISLKENANTDYALKKCISNKDLQCRGAVMNILNVFLGGYFSDKGSSNDFLIKKVSNKHCPFKYCS